METRELLELAAKAAGLVNYTYVDIWNCMALPNESGFDYRTCWNSLEDDGECARMESKLSISVQWGSDRVSVCTLFTNGVSELYSKHNGDKDKARRYASTQLAAEIGSLYHDE